MPLERAEFPDRLASKANRLLDYAAGVLSRDLFCLETPQGRLNGTDIADFAEHLTCPVDWGEFLKMLAANMVWRVG